MGRIFTYCLPLVAFVLLPFAAGMASPVVIGEGRVAGERPVQRDAVTQADNRLDLELLKETLKPLKKERGDRMNPRVLLSQSRSSSKAAKAESGEDEKPKKGAGKGAGGPNALWFRQGLEYSSAKQYDNAIAAFTLALAADHRDASSLYNRAVLYQRCGQYGAAIEDYTRAARIVPNEADLYYNRALAYQCSGNLRLAIEDYGKAIQLKPGDPWPRWNRGLAFSQEGREDLASTDFCSSIDLTPRP